MEVNLGIEPSLQDYKTSGQPLTPIDLKNGWLTRKLGPASTPKVHVATTDAAITARITYNVLR